MTDSHLRELERRFRQTGSASDEAVWLRARVQAGDLSEDRLRLAAYVGSEGATQALLGDPTIQPSDLVDWVRGLEVFGMEPLARASVALAEHVLSAWARRYPGDDRPARAIEATREWILCPCSPHSEAAFAALEAADGASDLVIAEATQIGWTDELSSAKEAAQAARYCGYSARPSRPPRPEECGPPGSMTTDGDDAAECAVLTLTSLDPEAWPSSMDRPAVRDLRMTVSAALQPWALGYSDPIRERVEARQRGA